ncbi:MAG: hypothetical protein IJ675_07100, partial [Pseudobutyrivibrio sp.]|nr:hypothetical protein [Pseudobutyrivibrio sp.]
TNYTVVGVTGNNNTGVGVGTSSISDNIDLGIGKAAKFASGYYPKGFTVNNSVINRGQLNAVLTTSNNSITISPGYYSGGTISANPGNTPNGTIKFDHHVHALDTAAKTVTNSSYSTTSVPCDYADSLQSTTKGGCFTTPYYHIKYSTTKTVHKEFPVVLTDHGDGWDWACTYCGRRWGDGGDSQTNTGPATHGHDVSETVRVDTWSTVASGTVVETRYLRSCGMVNGQVTDAHIHYN